MPLYAAADASRLVRWSPAAWALAEGWQPVIQAFLAGHEGQRLAGFMHSRLEDAAVVYPPEPFRALALTPLPKVSVVILGQDPYHGAGQAEGLAFSVVPGVRPPPSLRNIFKELHRDGLAPASALSRQAGSLINWARQGVLLLNSSLTVEDGQPASHAGQGWEALTDALLAEVAASAPACAYLLWGAHAQAKSGLIEQAAAQHGRAALVLKSSHPSPLAAWRGPSPFIGCGHFSRAQSWLAGQGVAIDWSL